MRLFHIPQYSIQNRNVDISGLNGAFLSLGCLFQVLSIKIILLHRNQGNISHVPILHWWRHYSSHILLYWYTGTGTCCDRGVNLWTNNRHYIHLQVGPVQIRFDYIFLCLWLEIWALHQVLLTSMQHGFLSRPPVKNGLDAVCTDVVRWLHTSELGFQSCG